MCDWGTRREVYLINGHVGSIVCLIKGHGGGMVCLIKGIIGEYGVFN